MNEEPRSRRHIVVASGIWIVLAAIGIAIMYAISPTLIANGALPPVASVRAGDLDQVLGIFTLLSIPVFALVVAYGGYSAVRFRSRGRPVGVGPAIRGNLPLQVSWLVVTLALVSFLFGYGLYFLNQVDAAPAGNVLHVDVVGEQWLWNYIYPDSAANGQVQLVCPAAQNPQAVQSTELELPVNRPVEFSITSCDVQHSFWIPALGIKEDAVPGEINHVTVTPDTTGDYAVRCAELCGLYHAYMNTPVHIVSASDFNSWLSTQQQQIPSAPSSGVIPGVGDQIVQRLSSWQEG